MRLIFACPVKSCRAFCANEAAFEAHFDAHLESRISGKIGDFFRRTSTDLCESEVVKSRQLRFQQFYHQHHYQRQRHVKSASSLVDLDMELDGLGTPPAPAAAATVTEHPVFLANHSPDDPDYSVRTSPAKLDSPPTTPLDFLDGGASSC